MTTKAGAHHPRVGRRALGGVLTAPVSARAWLATIHVLVGMPVAIVAFTIVLTLAVLTGGLLVTAVLAVATLWLLLGCVRGLTAIQRSRFRDVLGVELPMASLRYEGTWLRRLLAEGRAGSTWRQVAYHCFRCPSACSGSSW